MFKRFARSVNYERAAIAVTGLCVAALYLMVAIDRSATPANASVLPNGTMQLSALPGAGPPPAVDPVAKPTMIRTVGSAKKITEMFESIGYRLDVVRADGWVPRVFLASLPNDLREIRKVGTRKMVFIKTALPLILHVNELIMQDRSRIESLWGKSRKGAAPSAAEAAWLDDKAAEFGLGKFSFRALLARVDVIPPSLALAQSAEESGWGTSRFASEGNALFGQRVWRSKDKGKGGKGMVPKNRGEGETFRVKAFDHLIDGVKSYARNLNTHRAYQKFRRARANLRKNNRRLSGYELVVSLTAYSERGEAYVRTIRSIMRVNGFQVFDGVRLGETLSVGTIGPDA
jgi:Bax protein